MPFVKPALALTALAASLSMGTAALADGAPGFAEASEATLPMKPIEAVATGLGVPWSIAFLPSGDMVVTELEGDLRVIRNDALLKAPVAGMPKVKAGGQGGLMHVRPHPDFASNSLLYFTYAHRQDGRNTLRLARARYVPTEGSAALENLEVLFTANAMRTTTAHYGGRFVFQSDGTILLTSGDGYTYREAAQRLDTHFGKVLRLTEDGKAAPGNPFEDQAGALPEIWSYGHRNPQGITLAPDGRVFVSEHGPKGGDEVNLIKPGNNYGWPVACYCVDYSGAQITPYTELEGTTQPEFYWRPSIAPGNLEYITSTAFPELTGKVLAAGLAAQDIRIGDPETPAAAQKSLLDDEGMRLRAVTQGPDGALYVLTETWTDGSGAVLRLSPTGAASR
ncbi:MAG: PQQ-dependent sugar dehydrogenase [Pseudomonadota bacterium]